MFLRSARERESFCAIVSAKAWHEAIPMKLNLIFGIVMSWWIMASNPIGLVIHDDAFKLQAQTVGSGIDGNTENIPEPEFRIASRTMPAADSRPLTHNLSLFSKGVVYDFQRGSDPNAEPTEIVIYNSRTKRIALLDLTRKVQLELHEINLLKLLNGVRLEAEKDRRTRFLVHDVFDEQVQAESKSVTLQSPTITYSFVGETPRDENIMPVYFEFLDTFTRLQASDPRKLPPFPRIRLNQSIRRVGWIPTRVKVDVEKNALFPQPFTAFSEHEVEYQLTSTDRTAIENAKKHWSTFKKVGLAEYRGFRPTPKIEKLFRTSEADGDTLRR